MYEHLHSRPKHPTVQTSERSQIPPALEHASEPVLLDLSLPPTRTHWVNDDLVSNCTECTTKFSIFLRKHHCRKCGKIFCGDCSKYSGKLDSNAHFNLLGYICRLCVSCYQEFLLSLDGQICPEGGLQDSPSSGNHACNNDKVEIPNEASNAVNISLKVDKVSPDQAEAVSPGVPSDWQWSTF